MFITFLIWNYGQNANHTHRVDCNIVLVVEIVNANAVINFSYFNDEMIIIKVIADAF